MFSYCHIIFMLVDKILCVTYLYEENFWVKHIEFLLDIFEWISNYLYFILIEFNFIFLGFFTIFMYSLFILFVLLFIWFYKKINLKIQDF